MKSMTIWRKWCRTAQWKSFLRILPLKFKSGKLACYKFNSSPALVPRTRDWSGDVPPWAAWCTWLGLADLVWLTQGLGLKSGWAANCNRTTPIILVQLWHTNSWKNGANQALVFPVMKWIRNARSHVNHNRKLLFSGKHVFCHNSKTIWAYFKHLIFYEKNDFQFFRLILD